MIFFQMRALYLNPGDELINIVLLDALARRDRLKSLLLSGLQVVPDVNIGFIGQPTTRVSLSRERVLRKARQLRDVIAVRDAGSCTYLQGQGIAA